MKFPNISRFFAGPAAGHAYHCDAIGGDGCGKKQSPDTHQGRRLSVPVVRMEAFEMSELIDSSWWDMWTMPWARAVAGLVVLCIVIAVGFYVVSSFRDYAGNNRQVTYFADSNLQEMLRQGVISEAEFRTIQSKSYGVSVLPGDTPSPAVRRQPPVTPVAGGSIDASHDDEVEHPDSFLPPSTS
jgi:hypothetical protein